MARLPKPGKYFFQGFDSREQPHCISGRRSTCRGTLSSGLEIKFVSGQWRQLVRMADGARFFLWALPHPKTQTHAHTQTIVHTYKHSTIRQIFHRQYFGFYYFVFISYFGYWDRLPNLRLLHPCVYTLLFWIWALGCCVFVCVPL